MLVILPKKSNQLLIILVILHTISLSVLWLDLTLLNDYKLLILFFIIVSFLYSMYFKSAHLIQKFSLNTSGQFAIKTQSSEDWIKVRLGSQSFVSRYLLILYFYSKKKKLPFKILLFRDSISAVDYQSLLMKLTLLKLN
ncbi:MAG: hypothetical protein HON94_00425 [Methylococcales bacterium]|jgi:hypothetical protein|nr:hypothetical protein [Methylococcales bacterium]